MKYASTIILVVVLAFFFIWWSQKENQTLKEENERLKSEISKLNQDLDEYRYSPTLLLKQAKTFFNNREYFKAKEKLALIIHKHPNSKEAGEGKYLLQRVQNMISSDEKVVDSQTQVQSDNSKQNSDVKYSIEAMHSSYDVNEKATFYRDMSAPRYANENGFFLYFRKYRDKPRASDIRLRIQNISPNVLKIQTYSFKIDDKIYKITPQRVFTDSSSGQYWEWSDFVLDAGNYKIIDHVINSTSAKFRIEGLGGYVDNVLDAADKRALKNTIEAFKALGGVISF